ncbi:MAG: hypothetical protein ACREAA_03625 [Candidatus Polarisedimenticolia bacterium]
MVVLTQLNLERVVFNLMGGVRPGDATVNDAAYLALFLFTAVSMLSFIPLLPAYIVLAHRGLRKRFAASRASDEIE